MPVRCRLGAAARGAIEDTKASLDKNVKEEDSLVAVDDEQTKLDAKDKEQAAAAAQV